MAALVALVFMQGVIVGMRIEAGRIGLSSVAARGPLAAPPRSSDPTARPASATPRAHVTRPAASRAKAARVRHPDLAPFRGLGAWVDLYDLPALRPGPSLALMKKAGVGTLYIQTGTYRTRTAVDPRVRPWLVQAHRRAIEVVGWYLPGYRNLAHDVRRTVAIKNFHVGRHRFDAIGVDIEFRDLVRNRRLWNDRVIRHLGRVRTAVGRRYPLAAITPSPLQMRIAPGYWAGFPWERIGKISDVVMTMSYWSERKGCPRRRIHCAYEYTRNDVIIARKLTRGRVPIHIIGGIASELAPSEVVDFARAAADARAFGASLYDFQTTVRPFWRHLARIRLL